METAGEVSFPATEFEVKIVLTVAISDLNGQGSCGHDGCEKTNSTKYLSAMFIVSAYFFA